MCQTKRLISINYPGHAVTGGLCVLAYFFAFCIYIYIYIYTHIYIYIAVYQLINMLNVGMVDPIALLQ